MQGSKPASSAPTRQVDCGGGGVLLLLVLGSVGVEGVELCNYVSFKRFVSSLKVPSLSCHYFEGESIICLRLIQARALHRFA